MNKKHKNSRFPSSWRRVHVVAEPIHVNSLPTPHVAFSGRSNSGKSSLINALLNRKTLARVSKNPGRTHALIAYAPDEPAPYPLALVDAPGYGYAQQSKNQRRLWSSLILSHLQSNPPALLFILLDASLGPTKLDLSFLQQCRSSNTPHQPLLAKADKLSEKAQKLSIQHVSSTLLHPLCSTPMLVSSKTRLGVPALRSLILASCSPNWIPPSQHAIQSSL